MTKQLRVLTAADVRVLLQMHECIDAMATAFEALADGRATVPNRTSLPVPSLDGSLLLMPATIRGVAGNASSPANNAWFGAKLLSIAPGNHSTGHATLQGVIVLFDGEHGSPVAMMDAGAITAIRTAAVSGVATRLLARSDASRLVIIGAGVQAHSHFTAMAAVRPLRDVTVWSRDRSRCEALVRVIEPSLGIRARVARSAREALEGADIVCTVTSATSPVLESSWIAPGTHVNAIGAHRPTDRELDSDTIRRARVFVDHMPAAMVEAGDILIPIAEGCTDRAHVLGELSQLVAGSVSGRRTDDDVTVFKSVGIAIADIAAAALVYQRAVAADVGVVVELSHGAEQLGWGG